MNRLERVADKVDPGLSVRLRGLKMRREHDVFLRLQGMMGPAETVVDVGAYRGVYTRLMSVRVGRRGRVHALEPFPGNAARLGIIARRRGNITVHMVAASDRPGTGVLRVPIHGGHRIDALASLEPGLAGSQDSCEVPLRPLDELLAGERRISFLKCDVEGHEQRVFDGAARIIDRNHPVVFTEVEQRHRTDPIENTFDFFGAAGYRGWFAAGAGRTGLRPLEEFDVARDQLAFLDGRFEPYAMPDSYVYDFLFCPPGIEPPRSAIASAGSARGREPYPPAGRGRPFDAPLVSGTGDHRAGPLAPPGSDLAGQGMPDSAVTMEAREQ
jgi:FkbM family methyltransferase